MLGTLTVSNSGLPHHSSTSFSHDTAVDCYFETAARPLAAIAVLIDWHTRQLGKQDLRHSTHLRMLRRYATERTAVAADNEVTVALFEFREAAQLVENANGRL
jgi:hypothetical protein